MWGVVYWCIPASTPSMAAVTERLSRSRPTRRVTCSPHHAHRSNCHTPSVSTMLRFSAGLFRDDTLARAVIMNASLILIAATILVLIYN